MGRAIALREDFDGPGLLRLGHAYLSISDPVRRLEALRMLEAIAGAEDE